ncbi:MAG: glycosyltransferase [Marivirga sp.]|nr:glycosyltransferase [Marivirga sp.]
MPFNGQIRSIQVDLENRFLDFKGWKNFSKEVHEFKPDVIQANAGDTLKYAVLSKVFFRWQAPIVFRNASMISLYIKSRLTRWFNWFLLKNVTHIISVSEASRIDMLKTFPISTGKITVIPVGIEAKDFQTVSREESYKYLVHIGGFSFEKNHHGLLRIFRIILSRRPSTKLWLVGDGRLRQDMERYSRELKLGDAVNFLGFRSNAIDYIASADVLLLPSIIEGLPGVILEAFYSRTPVVANRVGGIPEVVDDERTGRLVEKEDEDGFAEAVLNTLENSDITRQRSERAHALVMEKYMNKNLTNNFLQLYTEIINTPI